MASRLNPRRRQSMSCLRYKRDTWDFSVDVVCGGYSLNFGNAGFILSHGCASDVHTSTCGLNQLGSSKLAVLIATNWGTASGLTTIGEPHSGQKPRWACHPP